MRFFLLLLFFSPLMTFAQIEGKVISKETNEPLIGAKIIVSSGEKTVTDTEGNFLLLTDKFPFQLIVSMSNYITDTVVINKLEDVIIRLFIDAKVISTIVVSAGRRNQKIEDVSVSMEILKPALINNKGITDLEQAVNQSPGVYAMDGQVSIRGGGGYSYGAGSRVLLLWNGIPMVSPDLGDAKWNAVPMENASQIEIMKGASSVLYGSGALNGVIAMNEKEPTEKREFRAKIQSGVYGNPKRESLKWWSANPTFHNMDLFTSKMHKKIGYSIALNGFTNDGYRKGEVEDRARINGTFIYKSNAANRLKAGLTYNFQYQYIGAFILWKSDSLGYIALGGDDPKASGSSVSYQRSIRLNIDPYLKFYDKKNNKHELKTRYYLVTTGDLTKIYASSKAEMYYGDYLFQHFTKKNSTLSVGLTGTLNHIISPVFKNHQSVNIASYVQYELKLKKFDFTAGARLEYFKQDNRTPDSRIAIHNAVIPITPIIRAGAHYKLAKFTHIRASFGQGVRFPSVAERFAATSVGGVVIFPNPEVQPEKGWAAEIGFKQIVKIGNWKGYVDIAGFVNQYNNMMEFTFGLYPPDTIALNFVPGTIGYIKNWVGFQSKNAEKARISGVEFSFNSEGKIGKVELLSLIGYTYMNPISLNADPKYTATFSDSGTNMLKYRFKHLAKIDIEAIYKKFSIGASMRYNSFMSNIDATFEDGFLGQDFLVGLKEYRQKNNKGSLVFDLRLAYKFNDKLRVGFIVNNFLNAEYVSRPADIQAPRNFIIQVQLAL
jgi:outer membrane receptor protein involved in Fe transport